MSDYLNRNNGLRLILNTDEAFAFRRQCPQLLRTGMAISLFQIGLVLAWLFSLICAKKFLN